MSELYLETNKNVNMQIIVQMMLMNMNEIYVKSEYLIVLKGTKFMELGSLG